ncbi:hypothetical protein BB560_007025 [Smittium megazygosporum]|uniref:Uncharacterized protein n=1 Tax=Smittium megazygosporum TaxID=133381 RepID=A0A2T9XZB4_9FUNG|nr:hypothetical protein BB560_007025 [Smittium megazygosporum]
MEPSKGSEPLMQNEELLKKNISTLKESIISTSKLIKIFAENEKELEQLKVENANKDKQISELKMTISIQQKSLESKIRSLAEKEIEIEQKNRLIKDLEDSIKQNVKDNKDSDPARLNSIPQANGQVSVEEQSKNLSNPSADQQIIKLQQRIQDLENQQAKDRSFQKELERSRDIVLELELESELKQYRIDELETLLKKSNKTSST